MQCQLARGDGYVSLSMLRHTVFPNRDRVSVRLKDRPAVVQVWLADD